MNEFRAPATRDASLETLLSRFVPSISIDVHRDHFVWQRKERVMDVPTRVYLAADASKVLGVGAAPADADFVAVDLFPAERDSHDAIRSSALEKFMKYGVEAIVGRALMIKPLVVVTNATSLQPLLHGYAAPVLADALFRAGASRVVFQPAA
jgi:hypothetical protein